MATLVFALIAFAGGYLAGRGTVPAVSSGSVAAPTVNAHANCYFSPHGGCTDAVLVEINSAQRTIELQGYALDAPKITEALLAAHRRGANVTVLLDAARTGEHRDDARALVRGGIPVYLDEKHANAHNAVILADSRTILTGSFNFTEAAEEENAENLLVLHDDARLQSAYEANFHAHLLHSRAYDGS